MTADSPPSSARARRKPINQVRDVARSDSRGAAPARSEALAKDLQQVVAYRSLPWPTAVEDPALQLSADDTFEVGRLIVEVIHGGSRNTHKSRKAWSLRRIQKHILRGASFATLARCVQTYETCRRLDLRPPLGDVRAGHLLNLANVGPAKQRMLLRKVGKQGLSVEQLRQSTGRTGQGTRRRQPSIIKALEWLGQHRLLDDLEGLSDLSRAEKKRVGRQIVQLREELKAVEIQLRRLGFA